MATAGCPTTEVAHRAQVIRLRDIRPYRERPRVARMGGSEPHDAVGGIVEPRAELIPPLEVLPGGIPGIVEEESRVARVLHIQIDLAAEQCLAHDRGRPN